MLLCNSPKTHKNIFDWTAFVLKTLQFPKFYMSINNPHHEQVLVEVQVSIIEVAPVLHWLSRRGPLFTAPG